jgi:hypothetical protein
MLHGDDAIGTGAVICQYGLFPSISELLPKDPSHYI